MAKLFICISERIEETPRGVRLIGFSLEGDCALDPGENPNKSPVLMARPAIEIAISIALKHVFGEIVHKTTPEQTFNDGMAIAADKIENPFSGIEEIPIED